MNSHITTTPLINSYKNGSLPASPHHSRLIPNLGSPKYLIASPTCGTPVRRLSERGSSPLLNSTVNVSLYTNTQSPGLASRIVQYDRAQNGSSPTYNRKFGSPGLFPIVHLGKQSVPVTSPKPKKVTVKIAPPDDLSMYNHIDHSIIMSENSRITTFPEHPQNESGTRSVLDALKEISRKRIHSAAEFDASSPPEVSNKKRNKRILESTTPSQANSLSLTPQLNNNNNNSNKRVREESPPDMNCLTVSSNLNNPNDSTKSTWKRYCSIDPITASFTSANLRLQELRKGPAKNGLDFPEDLPESPLRKTQQVSVDTQTHSTETIETIEDAPEEIQAAKPAEKPREAPLFDPRPLEVIRRNKLAALLGAINGEKPILEKVPLANCLETPQKQVTTISSAEKAPKHVTFDLPDVSVPLLTVTTNPNITQTTTSLVLPIASTMIAPSIISSAPVLFMASTTVPESAPLLQTQSTPPKVLGGFKFDLQPSAINFAPLAQTVANQAVNVLPIPSTNVSSSINEVPKFGSPKTLPIIDLIKQPSVPLSFGMPSHPSSTAVQTSSVTTPNFIFGTAVSPIITTSGTFGFGTSTSVATTSVVQPTFSFATKAVEVTPKVATAVVTSASTLPLFGGTTNVFAKPTIAPFQVAEVSIATTIGHTVGFPLTTSASTPKFGQLGTGGTLFGGTAATTNNPPTFSFGGSNTITPLTTSSTNITFGDGTISSATEKSSGIVAPTFGSTPINVAEKTLTVATPSFGNASTTANTIFGASPFAPPSTLAVASTTHSSFGGFGTVAAKTNTLPIKFGDTSAAAATTTAAQQSLFSFGGTAAPTEQPKMFASANGAATFSSTNNKDQLPSFGATKMTFGGFGNTSSNNAFGGTALEVAPPNQTVQPASNNTFSFGGGGGFGSTADSGFNKPASFDASTNNTNTFGANASSTNTFGAPNSNPTSFSSQTPAFGAPQSKLFTFGTATATPKAEAPPSIDKSGVFAFGTSLPKPQPSSGGGGGGGFNFSSSGTTFGSAVPPSFGAPNGAPPQQQQFAPPAFNVGGGFAAPPGLVGNPGMFSIGSGSSSGPSRPRAPQKTKRRT